MPSGSSTPRIVGSSVGRRAMSLAMTSAPVKRLKSVDFFPPGAIRIAHEGDEWDRATFFPPRLAVEARGDLDHLGQLPTDAGHGPRRWPRLSASIGSSPGHQPKPRAPTALAFQGGPGAHPSPRALVAERGQFHLQTNCLRGWRRGSAKISRDQAGPVEQLYPPCLLEVALLHWASPGPVDQHEDPHRAPRSVPSARRSCRCRREARAAPWAGARIWADATSEDPAGPRASATASFQRGARVAARPVRGWMSGCSTRARMGPGAHGVLVMIGRGVQLGGLTLPPVVKIDRLCRHHGRDRVL